MSATITIIMLLIAVRIITAPAAVSAAQSIIETITMTFAPVQCERS